ncbi:Hypothetical protein, putative [Bodo saltans]|uniref:Uncharacterized protein n=1 Tax=Bodo saltans TaxID=75058 RepID=A0A0S4JBP7_BODSA|nr:Hypothetical protein, putative [Bodo saltans]|eukprot:CUG87635.1 Hypothetical protein, putative [Bodo saltans]
MFDTLGLGGDRRAHTAIPGPRGAVGEAHQQQQQQQRSGGGKGHVLQVEKNMPSIVGVLGDVDRLYRPEITERLFGPPEVEADPRKTAEGRYHATERSKNASGERVVMKAYNSNNTLPPAVAGASSPSSALVASSAPFSETISQGGQSNRTTSSTAAATTSLLSGVYHSTAATDVSSGQQQRLLFDVNRISTRRAEALPQHELRKLQQRAQLLEHQLHQCHQSIENREAEIQIVQGLRDLHIAKKKTRLGYAVKDYETLNRQIRRAKTAAAAAAATRTPTTAATATTATIVSAGTHMDTSITTTNAPSMGTTATLSTSSQKPFAPTKTFVDHFSHQAAERAVNHNRLTQRHGVPTFHSGAGIPGESDGYCLPERHRRQQQQLLLPQGSQSSTTATTPLSPSHNAGGGGESTFHPQFSSSFGGATSTTAASTSGSAFDQHHHHNNLASSVRDSAQWRGATALKPRELMDRVAVPPVRCHTSHQPVGPRHFPQLHSTLAPFAAQDHQPMPQRRELAQARITTPSTWLERQAHRSVVEFNKAIVFTPNLRREPMATRTNTIPLLAPNGSGSSVSVEQ